MEGFVKINNDEFEDYYINKDGQVMRKKDGKIRMLSERLNAYGYVRVSLVNKEGKRVDRYLHRLLAETFIENPENKKTVNHIDGNKKNYKLNNLEWATHSENTKHMHTVLDKHTCIEECELYYMGNFVAKFDKIIDACEYAKQNYSVSYTSLQKYYTSNGCAIIKLKV